MSITAPTAAQVDQAISDIVSDATAQQADLAACLGVSEETVAKLTALNVVVDTSTLRLRADGIAEIKGSARRDNQQEIPVVLSFQLVSGKWTLLDGSLGALDSSISAKATL
ncbi:hypothetical protein [Rhizocola hellebori]|uniref:hypothetical protein n=1 Tax=Rhizocola hellebori TaxID=1392758 RepID=UPI0019445696|nr:hypothetical protein [Rhizocola hellebori]